MKTNLNTHDIYALVTELQYLIGAQVVNVYDITSQMICIKLRCKRENLDTDTDSDQENKHYLKYLIIESSTKFYILDQFTAVNILPSSFSCKLRKHLKNKRISKFEQINLDRVINIQFGTLDIDKNFYPHHLICEFYASGNIILTDYEYKILTLVHPYMYKNEDTNKGIARVGVGNIYPVNLATQIVSLSFETVKQSILDELIKLDKKIKTKQFLMRLPLIMFSPSVLEHVIINCSIALEKIDSNSANIFTDEVISQIITGIHDMFNLKVFNGYIINDSFIPYLYNQYKNTQHIAFLTFSECITQHFLKLDKFESKKSKKISTEMDKEQNISKQEKVLSNITNQINTFEIKTEENLLLVNCAELNIKLLQEFLDYTKTHITDHLTNPIKFNGKFEQIELLEYAPYKNQIKFTFNCAIYTWNTNISAYANINTKFTENKQIKEKIKKAEAALNIAAANTSTNTVETLVVNIKGKTKIFWFEEYNWFITSDKLIFVSGKTADQNEQLVKKYLNPDDLYIHSEVFGSGSGILKNNGKNVIERDCPKSIEESGNFLICHTKAWKSGVPDKSYWVYPNQVSKQTESGEYVCKGAFIVRGTKNFIPVNALELGLGILFKTLNSNELKHKLESDESNIEFAMPVVATYSALSKYKFKIKITTGTQKIKKVFPEVLGNFYKKANMFEKAGIKLIHNNDFQKVLISRVRFHL